MKAIKMMSGVVYPISEELFQSIVQSAAEGEMKSWVAVPGIGLVNLASSESVGELPKKAYWCGYELDKEEKYFMRDGQRVYLESKHKSEIEYRDDPKYTKQYVSGIGSGKEATMLSERIQ